MCRGILEQFSEPKVKTFISLSSPQAGQFGGLFVFQIANIKCLGVDCSLISPTDTGFLPFFPNFTRDNLYL